MHTRLILLFSLLVIFPLGFSPRMPAAQPGNAARPVQGNAALSPTQSLPSKQAPGNEQQEEEVQERVRGDVEEGVKHMLGSQVEAWNHHQLEEFMEGYWRSPQLAFFSGATVTKGWEPTLERYRLRYQSQGKEMGQLEFQDLNIDVISRRAAVVTGSWHLTMPDGVKPHGLFTLIVKKMAGGWKIVHDHTSAAQ